MAKVKSGLEATIKNEEQLKLADKDFDCDKLLKDKQEELDSLNEQLNQCRELHRLAAPKRSPFTTPSKTNMPEPAAIMTVAMHSAIPSTSQPTGTKVNATKKPKIG